MEMATRNKRENEQKYDEEIEQTKIKSACKFPARHELFWEKPSENAPNST